MDEIRVDAASMLYQDKKHIRSDYFPTDGRAIPFLAELTKSVKIRLTIAFVRSLKCSLKCCLIFSYPTEYQLSEKGGGKITSRK